MLLKNIFLGIVCLLFCAGFSKLDTPKLKDGYYYKFHRQDAVLFEVKGKKIKWYLDSNMKSFTKGEYIINETDTLLTFYYKTIWTSYVSKHNLDFEGNLEIKWDENENVYLLKNFVFREESEMIKSLKKRVKSSCKYKNRKRHQNQ